MLKLLMILVKVNGSKAKHSYANFYFVSCLLFTCENVYSDLNSIHRHLSFESVCSKKSSMTSLHIYIMKEIDTFAIEYFLLEENNYQFFLQNT